MKLKSIFFLILFVGFCGGTKSYSAARIQATSCSYTDVSSAIMAASPGDTVSVPAGSCMWDSMLTITQGIILIGAGIDNTMITSNVPKDANNNYQALVHYNPSNYPLNSPFRLSGFTFNQNNKSMGVTFGTLGKPTPYAAQTQIRIDHIRFYGDSTSGALLQGIWNSGGMWGVVDNCVFELPYPIRSDAGSQDPRHWDNLTYNFGGADNLYFEDNQFNHTTANWSVSDCQYSARYVFRYNTIIPPPQGIYYGFDLHGNWPYAYCNNNHSVSCSVDNDCPGSYCRVLGHCSSSVTTACFVNGDCPGGETCQIGSNMYSCFGGEIYGNKIDATAGVSNIQLVAARGGKMVVFYNDAHNNGVPLGSYWNKLWNDWCSAANPTANSESQDIHDTYFWGNRQNETGSLSGYTVDPGRSYCFKILGDPTGGTSAQPTYDPVVGRDFLTDSGTGASITCGSSLPEGCQVGSAFWLTSNSCVNLTNMVGANPSTPITGTLYKCTAPNAWTAYYTPYTYPHPFRTSGVLADEDTVPPAAPTGLTVN